MTCLLWAVEDSSIQMAEVLIKYYPSLLFQGDTEGATPLHYSALNGNTEMFSFLLSKGATCQRDNNGETPLHCGCFSNFPSSEFILHYSPDFRVSSSQFTTTLVIPPPQLPPPQLLSPPHLLISPSRNILPCRYFLVHLLLFFLVDNSSVAALNGHTEVMKVMLADERLDVNCQNLDGFTALHLAVVNMQEKAVKILLLDPRINIGISNNSGQTAKQIAERKGDTNILQLFVMTDSSSTCPCEGGGGGSGGDSDGDGSSSGDGCGADCDGGSNGSGGGDSGRVGCGTDDGGGGEMC
eukprot:TRINITY_DN3410_c0_g1_i7.p1 TRINITY_DN3410_c0_g1~~TRINITY_DN3410_c0_g1_i7.p1  ORF type:complete len:296 (-),score=62.91 TRINITY_DN3410_c0_g1_i7:491-1378(-)